MVKMSRIQSVSLMLMKSLVFVSTICLLVWYNMNRPKIMILHSYDPDVDIVKDFDLGIKQAIVGQIGPQVGFHYMNVLSKKAIHHKIESGKEARQAIDRLKPDVVIAVGDEAQEFAAKFYLGDKKSRIIFAGVKGDLTSYGYKPGENVAGIINQDHLGEFNNLILEMLKNLQVKDRPIKVGHIGDQSAVVDLVEKSLFEHAWQGVEVFDSVKISSLDDFKKAFKNLSKSCDMILISSCRGLKETFESDTYVSSKEVMHWATSTSKTPIISTFGYTVSEGGDAAIVSSYHEQGYLAILNALKMLSDPSCLPTEDSHFFTMFINKKRINDTGVDIPLIYESLAFSSQKLYA